MALYIDDQFLVWLNDQILNKFVKDISKTFETTDLSEIEWVLGTNVERNKSEGTITLNQIEQCTKEGSLEQDTIQKVPYHKATGCLQYISVCKRPNTTMSVSELSQFMNNSGPQHWAAVTEWLLRHLQGTKDLKLKYAHSKNIRVDGKKPISRKNSQQNASGAWEGVVTVTLPSVRPDALFWDHPFWQFF